MTLPKAGCPSKSEKKWQEEIIIREAAKRPKATFKGASGIYGKYWSLTVCDNKYINNLHMSGLWNRVARFFFPFLVKGGGGGGIQAHLNYPKLAKMEEIMDGSKYRFWHKTCRALLRQLKKKHDKNPNHKSKFKYTYWNGPIKKTCVMTWRGLWTGELLAIWWSWNSFVRKSRIKLPSQDVLSWWTLTQKTVLQTNVALIKY